MGFLEDRDLTSVPTISEYYKGKTVFITGGTGFVGKVLIEKLLYSCTELDRIYLLMRCKKGDNAEERLRKLYSSECFNRLKAERAGIFEEKVFAIAGDVMENGLGLSEEDRSLLINKVNIIFHTAASVRFDDHLTYAVQMNLKGTIRLLELAKETKHLSVLVHVSTTYTNTNRGYYIEEAVYTPHVDLNDILEICDKIDAHTLEILTPKYLNGIPNPYAFTKQLAEYAVYETKGQLPAAILRPSIVIGSLEEPTPGWVDNFNGPVGACVAGAKGIMHILYTKPDVECDYIPVDSCVKNIIAVSWIRGTKQLEATDDIPVYNSCSTNQLQLTMGEMIQGCFKGAEKYPFDNNLWFANTITLTTSRVRYFTKVLLAQVLPALFIDALLKVLGRKPRLMKIQRIIYRSMFALEYYMTNDWNFKNDNSLLLCSRLKENDKYEFYYNIKGFDLDKYFDIINLAVRRYVLHEKDEDIPKARAHNQRLWWLDLIVKFLIFVLICKLLYNCFFNDTFVNSNVNF